MPVGCIRKARRLLPDCSLVSGVQSVGCDRAGVEYTAVAQDAKKELLGKMEILAQYSWDRITAFFERLPTGEKAAGS